MSSPVLPTGVEDSPPSAHKILVVIEPLLIDQDYYARVEDREIISNLAKAAGLAHMISTMRPDLDHQNEDIVPTQSFPELPPTSSPPDGQHPARRLREIEKRAKKFDRQNGILPAPPVDIGQQYLTH
ncbi:hypothetical protein B5807_07405 [Epicoccum nigrum]|uniref:Uncharacterized protein n=1 Tax=Epicoccum nigrum TaxID=105696 RepID=A0A1Y2LV51_EPING|nr:hypothetical protein B5807_07405 [Epicoccum nigrum]